MISGWRSGVWLAPDYTRLVPRCSSTREIGGLLGGDDDVAGCAAEQTGRTGRDLMARAVFRAEAFGAHTGGNRPRLGRVDHGRGALDRDDGQAILHDRAAENRGNDLWGGSRNGRRGRSGGWRRGATTCLRARRREPESHATCRYRFAAAILDVLAVDGVAVRQLEWLVGGQLNRILAVVERFDASEFRGVAAFRDNDVAVGAIDARCRGRGRAGGRARVGRNVRGECRTPVEEIASRRDGEERDYDCSNGCQCDDDDSTHFG